MRPTPSSPSQPPRAPAVHPPAIRPALLRPDNEGNHLDVSQKKTRARHRPSTSRTWRRLLPSRPVAAQPLANWRRCSKPGVQEMSTFITGAPAIEHFIAPEL